MKLKGKFGYFLSLATISVDIPLICRSQWPCGLRRRSAAARLLRFWVRIPPEAWTFICFECCVLSGRSLCDELITRPEESYRLWCVVVCDLETSWMRRPWPTGGCCAKKNKQKHFFNLTVRTYHSPGGILETTPSQNTRHDFERFLRDRLVLLGQQDTVMPIEG